MNRAIITGATGAIGTALIAELVERGTEILVFTRKDSERNSVIPKHPMVKVLYAGLSELKDISNETGKSYDVFYHFAWAGASGRGRNDMYLQNDNVRFALDAVALAKRFGCRTFIGAGSQAEYGRHNGRLSPDTPTFPEMGYGYAKLCAGQMTREYAGQLGLRHVWTRILSIYGPNDGQNSLISSLISSLKRGTSPEMTKGEQEWDYLYSRDAAEAFFFWEKRELTGKHM